MVYSNVYGGDANIHFDISEEKKNKIVDRILEYCIKNECFDGETLHQSDNCLIDAPSVLSNIIDDIIDFKIEWL